MILYRYPKNGC